MQQKAWPALNKSTAPAWHCLRKASPEDDTQCRPCQAFTLETSHGAGGPASQGAIALRRDPASGNRLSLHSHGDRYFFLCAIRKKSEDCQSDNLQLILEGRVWLTERRGMNLTVKVGVLCSASSALPFPRDPRGLASCFQMTLPACGLVGPSDDLWLWSVL